MLRCHFLIQILTCLTWSITCDEISSDSVSSVPKVAKEDSLARSYVEKRGGYIHPQLFVGIWGNGMRGVGVDPSESSGVIKEGTLLFRIPWSMTAEAEDDCDMVRYLSRELKRYQSGEESKYGEYLTDVVRIQDQYDFLSSWLDEEGGDDLETQRQLLQGLPPNDFDRHTKWLQHTCGFGDPKGWDKFARQALLFLVSYATNEGVIPYFDLLNSHRGLHNIRLNPTPNELEVYASRDIKAGEQLWNLYGAELSTSDVWRDYGYIEEWPRRWKFEVEQEVSWLWGWINTTARVQYAFEILPGNMAAIDTKYQSSLHLPPIADNWKKYSFDANAQISDSRLVSIRNAATLFLANLETTIEEDETLISQLEEKKQEKKKNIIMYRLQYKRDIRTAIETVDNILKKRESKAKTSEL